MHKPKAALEAQALGAAIPHCGSGSWLHFEHEKQNNICCTPHHHEILPCQALHPYPGFQWKKSQVCRQGRAGGLSKRFLTEIRYQEKVNPDMDPYGASLRSAGLHCHTISRCRKPSAQPELILSLFQRDYFSVTVIQKLILIVLELMY